MSALLTRVRRNTTVQDAIRKLSDELVNDDLQELLARELERKARANAQKAARRLYRKSRQTTARQLLSENGGNVKRTARDSGLPESTLRRWRQEWDIPAFPDGAEAVRRSRLALAS